MTVFNYKLKPDATNWRIVDDVVMGGCSNSSFFIANNGRVVFKGNVSLENNGGFSMVQYSFKTIDVSKFSKVILNLKGDGKTYQFRIKANKSDSHSFVTSFETNGDWQTLAIDFNILYPTFRGKTLSLKNYEGKQMEMIAFLIGNKINENFKLEIEHIILQ